MTKDFADFLESRNREGVAYVVIGGIAVLAHIPYRTTRDLDVLIEPTIENAERASRAVAAWGSFDQEMDGESDGYLGADGCTGSKRSDCVIQLAEYWRGPHLPYRSGEWKFVSVTIKRGPAGQCTL